MKNILLVLLVSFIGMNNAFSQGYYQPNHIDSLHYDSCHVYKTENSEETIFSKFVYTYEGLPIEKFFYDKGGDLHQYKHYNYDSRGNVIERYSQDYPKVWGFTDTTSRFAQEMIKEARWHNRKTRYEYEYDDRNLLVKTKVFSVSYDKKEITENDQTYTEEKQYDGCGRLTLKVEYGVSAQNGSDTSWYSYDSEGLLALEKRQAYNKNPYSTKYSYNDSGLCVKKANYDYQQQRLSTWVSEYDSEGNLVTYIRFDENMEVVMEEKIVYPNDFDSYYIYKSNTHQKEEWSSYDSLERIVTNHEKKLKGSGYYVSPLNGKSIYKSKFKYDSLGRVIEDKFYWKRFPISEYYGKTQFEYNDKNQKIKEIEFDENDILTDVTMFFYNAENQVIKTADYLSNDTLYGYTYFTYDSIGQVATREMVDSVGVVELFQTYEYNESGVETGGVFYRNGYYELLESYTYNSDGTAKSITVIEKQGNKIKREFTLSFEYFYDIGK